MKAYWLDRDSCKQSRRVPAGPLAVYIIAIFFSGCSGLTHAPAIITSQVPSAKAGAPYSTALAAHGGIPPYTWGLASGALPPGVSLDPKTGALSGVPAQTGNFNFTVQVVDSTQPKPGVAMRGLSLVVGGAVPQIITNTLPNAQVGTQVQDSLAAAGGVQPYHWSLASGTLPSGLALNDAGALAGTPTQAGRFDFTAQVSDSASPRQTAVKPLSLTVVALTLQIASSTLPNAQVGVPYQASVTAGGGLAPYTWSVAGGLPSGLTLNASSGAITGTPTLAGGSTFMILLSDSAGQSAQKSFTITVAAASAQPLAISTNALPQPVVQQAYSQTLQATGGTPPYAWSVASGQLPAGLALAAAGQLAGTPTAAGASSFTVQVADSASPPLTASKTFSLTVAGASAPSALDQYGGDANHPCVGIMKNGSGIPGATGFFYLYKDTNLKHWMFCDPLGNRFWMTAVQEMTYGGLNYSSIVGAKYGPFRSSTSWEAIQTKRMQAMGFNTVGEFSRVHLWAPNGNQPNPIPFIWVAEPAHYGVADLKEVYANLPPKWDTFNGYRGYRGPDFYDPKWAAKFAGVTNASCDNITGGCSVLDASPWLVASGMDDAGNISQMIKNQAAYVVAIGAPYEQFENSLRLGRKAVFSTPAMYSKQQWSTWLCGTRYANLAALNAAWGSTYTTCGSAAVTAAQETIGTGNGSQTSFSYTFLHTVVDPASIGISVGGVLQAGDTPWFNSNECGQISGAGCIQSATGNINGGAVTYATGAITVTFSVAPANGVAITATYQYGGWPKATAGGTGLLDEDGTSPWWPAGDPGSLTAFPDPPVGAIQSDMDVFLGMWVQQYLQPLSNFLRTQLPHHVVSSPNPLSANLRASVFTQLATYCDVLVMSEAPLNATSQTNLKNFYNTYNRPVYLGMYATAQPDSQFSAAACPYNPPICFATQDAKGAYYLSDISASFNSLPGADGYGFSVGMDYWQYTDNSSESGAYGLVSLSDNLYNGIESCGKSITDPWGLTTTPEPTTGCYGDFISSVKAANRIWLGP